MGLTMNHAAAVVVPIVTGFILNFVGYQIPFMVAAAFAVVTIFVTRMLNPAEQRTPEKIVEDEERASRMAAA